MPFSILHISDLHQNLNDEIPSEWLLDSLVKDVQAAHSSNPSVPLPSICVVSGDIVYGITANNKSADCELERQYQAANEFLVGLCDTFFNGNRNRIVIIPGNHDIDYSSFIRSGSFIDVPESESDKGVLVGELFSPNSKLRWSWSKLKFFRITDNDTYDNRLDQFSRFYNLFYSGERQYSLDPALQYDIFDFPDLNFCVMALSSCHNNDPMNRVGTIHPIALTNANREISNPSRAGWLVAASWHHDVSGGILHEDFLDAEFLQLLIDAGVTLGLHGHRHRSACFEQRNQLGGTDRSMAVIASGTLCAAPRNLSPGVPRGYNIIEIDASNSSGRVHQRKMINQLQNLPIWGPGVFIETNKPYMDFSLMEPKSNRPTDLNKKLALEKASDSLGQENWEDVLSELKSFRNDPYARKMLTFALGELQDDHRTIVELNFPQNIVEAVLLGSAILESGELKDADHFLSLEIIAKNSDASVTDICSRLKRKFKL